jgi:hypothetical protein
MTIPGQFGFNCPSGFREEAFWNIFPIGSNVKLSPAVAAIWNFIPEPKSKFVEDHLMNKWSLEGPLQNLCFLYRSEIQDGRHRNT